MIKKARILPFTLVIIILVIFSIILLPNSQVDGAEKPNIILIVVDTLRADHVSAYGYARETTPNLDSWLAQEGALFTNASTSIAWTYPANAGMLTGKQPANFGVVWSQWQNLQNKLPTNETLLAEYLQAEGYATAGFNSAYFVSERFGFARGFDVYEDHLGRIENKTWANVINAEAQDWITNEWDSNKPMFLFLYYFDPHAWYNPPAPYDTLYDPTYTGTLTAAVYQNGRPVHEGTIIPTARDIEHIIALYDGSISYWDAHFGEMMTFLEQNNVLDNSIVIVTSDHGEMFGEHGEWAHHNSVYEEVIRVPFLVRYDGVVAKDVVFDAPISTIDVTPTILDFLGLPVPDSDGVSLASGLRGETTFPQDRPIYSEADAIIDIRIPPSWHAPRHELRAVQQSGWKYIYGFKDTTQELYQLNPNSLYEDTNLYGTQPDQVDTMHTQLDEMFFIPSDYQYTPFIRK